MVFQPRDSRENPTGKPVQRYKISFFFEGSPSDAKKIRRQFSEFNREHGLANVQIVVSHRQVLNNGRSHRSQWNLDLVPVSKQQAIDFMAKKYGCRGVVAGDSGNDSEMIFQGGDNTRIAGGIVGNAKPELKEDLAHCCVVRETNHFKIVKTPDNRLIYVEPDSSKVRPESLQRMFQAFSLFDKLRIKKKPAQPSSAP